MSAYCSGVKPRRLSVASPRTADVKAKRSSKTLAKAASAFAELPTYPSLRLDFAFSAYPHAALESPLLNRLRGDPENLQKIFDEFKTDEIGIEIYKFEHSFFDRKTKAIVSFKTAPADADAFIVSGTKLRGMLQKGELPPEEVTRPEVAKILIDAMKEKQSVKG